MSFSEAEWHFANAKNKNADEAVKSLARGLEELTRAIKNELDQLKREIRDK
jgi:hypothetical protein